MNDNVKKENKLQASGEDYMEAILILKKRLGDVRPVDLAQYMNFSRPSISRAVSKLRKCGYLKNNGKNNLDFTSAGETIAKEIWERHNCLKNALIALGVSEQAADEDACKMEHTISREAFSAIKKYLAKKETKQAME